MSAWERATHMILGAEIALTIMGLLYLIRGKGLGKQPIAHPHYRWLGAFALTMWPVALVIMMIVVGVLVVSNPEASLEGLQEEYRWPLVGLEGGIVLVYVVAVTLWEKAIKRKATAQATGV